MKALLVSVCFCALVPFAPAQTVPVHSEGGADAKYAAPTITRRGDDFSVVEWDEETVLSDGTKRFERRSYVELATGLNYLDNGEWKPTEEAIEILPDGGAAALKGPHRAFFEADINVAGAIELELPDGTRLRSHVLGLAYFEKGSGRSVLLGEIRSSNGLLLPSGNQVLYPDAFSGVKADIRFTYTKAGFEQDIIVREQLPSPAEWGLDPATTVLQVMTEFLDRPEPARREVEPVGDIEPAKPRDMVLDFGSMRIGRGRAFPVGAENDRRNALPVRKSWERIDGRDLLFEEVDYPRIAPELMRLPAPEARALGTNATPRLFASVQKGLPAALKTASSGNSIQVAGIDTKPTAGFVMDYLILNGSTNAFTFRGDQTYYVTGDFFLNGAATFEGGAVIKYAPAQVGTIYTVSHVDFQTSFYRPVIFTARDDNSVGATISGSTGSPTNYYANWALCIDLSPSTLIENCRFKHASVGIFYASGPTNTLRHCQFVDVGDAVINTSFYGTTTIENILLRNVSGAAFSGGGGFDVAHLTANGAGSLIEGGGPFSIKNSLFLAGMDGAGDYEGDSNYIVSSGDFAASSGGSSYLATNSTYRNLGTTNLSAALKSDFRFLTTHSPVAITTNFAGTIHLRPQVQRDTDLPDIGYHYPAIDFLWTNRSLAGNLVLTNGVAVAVSGYNGLSVSSGSIVSRGDPVQMNRLVCNLAVQEKGMGITNALLFNSSGTSYPVWQMDLRFTELSAGVGGARRTLMPWEYSFACQKFILRDCHLRGLYCDLNASDYNYLGSTYQVSWTNNIFEYCDFAVYQGSYSFDDGIDSLSLEWLNNLFRKGSFTLQYLDESTSPYWVVRNNLFDGVNGDFYSNDYYYQYYVTASHNGFTSGTSDPFSGFSTSNKSGLTNNFQKGPLGRFYYPTNGAGATSLTNLVNTGYLSATNYALYHFTTTTNQVKETTTTVDIGFHYASLDSTGQPVDGDGDGWADWQEDLNGNGIANGGEFNWQFKDRDNDGVHDDSDGDPNNPAVGVLTITITSPAAGTNISN